MKKKKERNKLCPFSTWDITLAKSRIHKKTGSILSSTNLNVWNLTPVWYHPRFAAPPDSFLINIFWVCTTRLLSSTGRGTTMWTGATTNLWFPSSQNHSAILHSAGQLLLPYSKHICAKKSRQIDPWTHGWTPEQTGSVTFKVLKLILFDFT